MNVLPYDYQRNGGVKMSDYEILQLIRQLTPANRLLVLSTIYGFIKGQNK